MIGPPLAWAPALLLAIGAAGTLGVHPQRSMPLRTPLGDAVPQTIGALSGTDVRISDAQFEATRASAYLLRHYKPRATTADSAWLQLYIGYYDQQTQGRSVHSPKNCLPGAGWGALASEMVVIETPRGPVTVNRYLVQREHERALVLYWYQGRGRVEASEYGVKLDLLRDAALQRRTEEAVVRVVVPVTDSEAQAFERAAGVARDVVPAMWRALPS